MDYLTPSFNAFELCHNFSSGKLFDFSQRVFGNPCASNVNGELPRRWVEVGCEPLCPIRFGFPGLGLFVYGRQTVFTVKLFRERLVEFQRTSERQRYAASILPRGQPFPARNSGRG